MELKEGMYVRTDKGLIGKITKKEQFDTHCILEYTGQYCKRVLSTSGNDSEVIKASFDIIDLIEEKDLVEIEFYSPRYRERIIRLFEVDYIIKNNICFENGHCQLNILNGEWTNSDKQLKPIIKSVITHELFESMKYEVSNE